MSEPLTKEEKRKIGVPLMEHIRNNPIIRYESENKAYIVRFDNFLYLKGGLYMCENSFQRELNNCYVWCKKNDCDTIYFFINSTGGNTRTKNGCVEKFQNIKKKWATLNIQVECIVIDYCCSGAVELALECDIIKLFKNAKMGIHYPQNIKYQIENNSIKELESDKVLTNEEKINYETYYQSKLKLEDFIVKKLLTESKLLNTEEILKYNFASEVIKKLPVQFKELKNSILIESMKRDEQRKL